MGSVRAYIAVKRVWPSASLNLLWALEGALSGIPWHVVAKEHRLSLLLALEEANSDAPLALERQASGSALSSYGSLCTEFYDADKPTAPPESLAFYLGRAREAQGRVLEPMCGSGRYLLPMIQSCVPIDGVDASPAMLRACLAHAARLGINASVYLQEVTSLQLPHRYAMVFVPSGSIGLITEDEDLRAALSRIRSHMESNGRLLLELAAHDRAPSQPTVLEPRTVAGPDGTVITYSCTVSEAASPDSIRFSGRYEKRAVDRVLGTEREELILRMYRAEHLVQELATCGFRSMRVSTACGLPFLAESGCTLVEASADACSH